SRPQLGELLSALAPPVSEELQFWFSQPIKAHPDRLRADSTVGRGSVVDRGVQDAVVNFIALTECDHRNIDQSISGICAGWVLLLANICRQGRAKPLRDLVE